MAYVTIFDKGERPDITTAGIKVECGAEGWTIQINDRKPKSLSYEYAYMKGRRLAEWLREQGIYWDNMLDAWKDKPEGYRYLLETIHRVEITCQLLKIECHCMLNKQLIEYEGFLIEFNGEAKRVYRTGKYIKFHMLIKDGNRWGSSVRPEYDFKDIKII